MRRLASLLLALNLMACCNPAELVKEHLSGGSSSGSASSPAGSLAVAAAPTPSQSGVIAAPSSTKPPPFAVGQWTRHSVRRPNGASSLLEYKIISKQGDAYWFEVVMQQGSKQTVIQFLLVAKDRGEWKSFELKEFKLRMPNGRVQVFRGMQVQMARKVLDSTLARMRIPEFGTGPREDTKVPAGTFQQCYVNEVKGTYFGVKMDSKVWNHPAVPISTLIRSNDRADGAEVVLEGYGMTGATSVMGR